MGTELQLQREGFDRLCRSLVLYQKGKRFPKQTGTRQFQFEYV